MLPLLFSSFYIYHDFDEAFLHIEKNLKRVEKNDSLYKMMLLVQDYELSARLYLDENSSTQAKEALKKSEERLYEATQNLAIELNGEIAGYAKNYYEQAHLSLLSEDIITLSKYTQEYKYFLYKRIVSVKLNGFSDEEETLAKMAYLFSVELPYATLLLSDTQMISERNERLIKLGEFKATVEKMDLVLQSFQSYTNHFENENTSYKHHVQQYIRYLIKDDTHRSIEMQDTILSLQLSLFNALEELIHLYLLEQMQELRWKQYLYISIALLFTFLALYFLIGAYMSLRGSLQRFFAATVAVSRGELDARVEIQSEDELSEIADEFNTMLESLDYHYALLNEYKRAVDASAIVLKTDLHGVITYVNSAYEKISGYSENELVGSTHRLLRSKNTKHEQIAELWEFINNKKSYKTVFENIAKNGKSFFVESTIVPLLNRSGEISEFIAIMFDITPLYRQREKLQSQLYKDELTSLPNRLKLLKDIAQTPLAKLVVINIDGFKEINTIYGENIGDMTLQKMAKEIKNALNTRHLQLYKLSADEFAILAGKNVSIEYFKEDVALLAHYLSHIKLECAEHEISVRLSLGAAISELHHSQRPLISMADMALKEAKRRMKPYLFYYNLENVDEDLEKNYQMVQVIEQAIKEEKIGCSYQGIFNAKTGKLEKYETLMRLEDASGLKISPQDFVDIAKRARYYPQLTQRVVQEALFTFMDREESVSLNLSIDDMMDDSTYHFILDALRNCGCADRVIFELLESEEIDFNERVFEFTHQVKKLGAQVAIDDFGSGYSNYAYLMKLGVDILKIDASLIKEVHQDENSRLIVASIIDIAHALGMETVAEHVHNKEVESVMKEMGVDYLQGYYLHEPVHELG